MNPERSIEIGGRAYPLLFSQNAAFQLELYLKQNKMGTLADFMSQLLSPQCGPMHFQIFMWACLEGARRKTNGRFQPYTVDEVGDLIDTAGGLDAITNQLMEALTPAIPKAEDTDTKNEPARSGTGKRSSRRASTSASPLTNSGTAHSAKSNS